MSAVSMCVEVPGSCQKMIKNLEIILNSTHSASNSRRLHKTHSHPVRQGKKNRKKPTNWSPRTYDHKITHFKPTINTHETYE